MDAAHGLSIYFPTTYISKAYLLMQFATDCCWVTFLMTFIKAISEGESEDRENSVPGRDHDHDHDRDHDHGRDDHEHVDPQAILLASS